jgi:hypothetical protein
MQKQIVDGLRAMSPEAFAMLGAPTIAYVKEITSAEGPMYGVFAVTGQQVGVFVNRDQAFAAARQHDLEPVSAH